MLNKLAVQYLWRFGRIFAQSGLIPQLVWHQGSKIWGVFTWNADTILCGRRALTTEPSTLSMKRIPRATNLWGTFERHPDTQATVHCHQMSRAAHWRWCQLWPEPPTPSCRWTPQSLGHPTVLASCFEGCNAWGWGKWAILASSNHLPWGVKCKKGKNSNWVIDQAKSHCRRQHCLMSTYWR